MPANEKQEPKGLLGRLWGPKKSVSKARLDTDDTLMYYSNELGMWVERGKEAEAAAAKAGPPPPPSSTSSRIATPINSSTDLAKMNSMDDFSVTPTEANTYMMGRNSMKDPRKRYPDALLSKTSKQSSTMGKSNSFAQLLPSAGPTNMTSTSAKAFMPSTPAIFMPGQPIETAESLSQDEHVDSSMSKQVGEPAQDAVGPLQAHADGHFKPGIVAPHSAFTNSGAESGTSIASELAPVSKSALEQDSSISPGPDTAQVAGAREPTSAVNMPDATSTMLDGELPSPFMQGGAGQQENPDGSDSNNLHAAVDTASMDMQVACQGMEVDLSCNDQQGLGDAPGLSEVWTEEDQQHYDYWLQLQQYGAYYRQEGYSEEQIAEYFTGQGTTEQLVMDWLQYYNTKWQAANAGVVAEPVSDSAFAAAEVTGSDEPAIGNSAARVLEPNGRQTDAVVSGQSAADAVYGGTGLDVVGDAAQSNEAGHTGTDSQVSLPSATQGQSDANSMPQASEMVVQTQQQENVEGAQAAATATEEINGTNGTIALQDAATKSTEANIIPPLESGSPGSQPSQSVSLASWEHSRPVLINKAQAKLRGSMPWEDLGPRPATRSNSETSTPRMAEHGATAWEAAPCTSNADALPHEHHTSACTMDVTQVVRQATASLSDVPLMLPPHAALTLKATPGQVSGSLPAFDTPTDLTFAGWQIMDHAVPDLLATKPSESSVTGPVPLSEQQLGTGATDLTPAAEPQSAGKLSGDHTAGEHYTTPDMPVFEEQSMANAEQQTVGSLHRSSSLQESCASAPTSAVKVDQVNGDMQAALRSHHMGQGGHRCDMVLGGELSDLDSKQAFDGWGVRQPGASAADDVASMVDAGNDGTQEAAEGDSWSFAPAVQHEDTGAAVTAGSLHRQPPTTQQDGGRLLHEVDVLRREKAQLVTALEQAKEVTKVACEGATLQAEAVRLQGQLDVLLGDMEVLADHGSRLCSSSTAPHGFKDENGWGFDAAEVQNDVEHSIPVLQSAKQHAQLARLTQVFQLLASTMLEQKRLAAASQEQRVARKQNGDVHAATHAEADQLRKQVEQQAETIDKMQQQLETLASAETRLQEEADQAVAKAAVAEQQAAQWQDACHIQKQLAQRAEEKAGELQRLIAVANEQLQQQNAVLEGTQEQSQLQQLQDQVDLLRETLEEQGNELASSLAAKEALIAQLQEQSLIAKENLQQQEVSSAAVDRELRQLTAQMEDAVAARQKAEARAVAIKKKAEQLLRSNKELKEQISAQKTHGSTDAATQLAQLQQDIATVQAELSAKSAALEEASNAAAAAQQELREQHRVALSEVEDRLSNEVKVAQEAAASSAAASHQQQVRVAELEAVLANKETEAEQAKLHAQQQCQVLQSEKADLMQQLQLLQADAERLQQHGEAVQQQLTEAQSRCDAEAHKVAHLEEELAAVQQQLAAATEQLFANEDLADLQATVADKDEQIDMLRESLADANDLLQASELAVASQAEQLSAATAHVQELQRDLAASRHAEQQLTEVQEQLSAAQQATKESVQQLTQQLEDAQQESMRLSRALDAAIKTASSNGAAKENVTFLQQQIHELQGQVEERDRERQLQQRRLVKAKQELKARADARAAAEAECARLTTLVAELQRAHGDEVARVSALQAEVADVQEKKAVLEASMQSVVGTMQGAKDVTSELQRVQEQLAMQQAEFNDLLACLGQETAKVTALQSLLEVQYQEDVTELLNKVEEEYGFGDANDDEEDYLTENVDPLLALDVR